MYILRNGIIFVWLTLPLSLPLRTPNVWGNATKIHTAAVCHCTIVFSNSDSIMGYLKLNSAHWPNIFLKTITSSFSLFLSIFQCSTHNSFSVAFYSLMYWFSRHIYFVIIFPWNRYFFHISMLNIFLNCMNKTLTRLFYIFIILTWKK